MKVCAVRMFIVFLTSLMLFGCASNSSNSVKPGPAPVTSDTSLRTPTKEILVTDGDINKKYTILGQVEHKLTEGSSVYSDQIEKNKQAKEFLKKEAFTKYGDKVDAIINTKVQESLTGGFWGAVGAGYGARNVVFNAEGIAVSFDNEQTGTVAEPKESAAPKVSTSKGKRKTRKAR